MRPAIDPLLVLRTRINIIIKKKVGKIVNLLQHFASFFKVGIIGFGGGSALIPVIEREIVEDRMAMSDEDYLKHTVVANITPGALPVKLGATIGADILGIQGSVVGAYAVMIPGVFLTVLIMSLFSFMGEEVINYFNYAAVGITAFIIFLLVSYVIKTVKGNHFRINILICMLAFALTGGKEFKEVIQSFIGKEIHIFGTPLFDISTIHLILIAFFLILSIQRKNSFLTMLVPSLLAGIYAFLSGKLAIAYQLIQYKKYILIMMFIYLIFVWVKNRNTKDSKTKSGKLRIKKSSIVIIGVFLLIPVSILTTTIVFGLFPDTYTVIDIIKNICISTVTSFGGGEAYVSVADGIFVQSGYIQPDIFYARLVPIANALPGPILVKIAAGIGYVFGLEATGSAALGWILATVAATFAVGACSAIAILVLNLYDDIKESVFVMNLKKYILPTICGMLISTSLSMLYESMKVTAEKGIGGFVSMPIIIVSIWGMYVIHKKYHVKDIVLLLLSAVISFLILLLT